ncbi:hypothetical protein HANVADRAFT_1459 [Hanseniaspora valbyensis NRRL Y-1626]|uniref:Uncharacterized protein n=1 Tax=Hanseniaspora valbyensis NRRL Y-1626 TaxID=766949 RepID=A0A1B7TGW2_9ASCO|nr:hypothetical protein HANVADRAFT_1459 [Hanseniaspora valbyensis NRRL Y-1626]
MSILPDFESSALSSLSQTKNVKRKFDDIRPLKNENGIKSNDNNNNTEDNEEEEDKSNNEKFHIFVIQKLNLSQDDNSSNKSKFKKQKKFEEEKSNNEKFHIFVIQKLNLSQDDNSSNKSKFKKQKKIVTNTNMTTLEQIYFSELLNASITKSDKFLYKTLYNIQSLNTQSKQRKKYNKRIHSLVAKNPDSMIMRKIS